MPSVSAVESLVSGALKSTLKAAQKSYSFLNKKQLSRKERKKEKKLQRKLQRQFSVRNTNNNNNNHNSSSASHHHHQNHHHQQQQQEREKELSTSAGCSSSIDDSLVGNKHIRKFNLNNKNQHQKQHHHQKTKFQLNKTGNFQNKGNIFKGGKKLHNNNSNNHHSLVNGNTHNNNGDSSPGKFVKLHNNNNNNNNSNSGISNHKKINKYVNNNNNLSLKSPKQHQQQVNKFRRGSDSSSSEEEEEEGQQQKKLLSIQQQKKEQVSEEEELSDSDSELENCNNNIESEPLEFTKTGPQVSPFILTIRSKYLCLNNKSPSKVKEGKEQEEKENHKISKSTSSTTTAIVNGHNKNTKESLLLNKSTANSTSTVTNNNNNNTDSSKKNKIIQNELPASSGLKSKALSSRMNGNSSSNIVNGGSSSSSSGGTSHPVPRLAEPKYILFHRDQVKPGWDQSTRLPVGSGLINLGNTCYLNATLQALLHTPAFVNWLLNDKDHEKKCKLNNQLIQQCTICAMSKTLLEAYKSPNCAPIRPMPIYSKLKSICKHFQHGRQEDAHEFLRYLLESMERSYLNAVNGQKLDNRSKETTPLSQIFGGYIRTEVTCLKCQYVSTTFQPLAELQLDIRHVSTLEDAIQNHFKKERLDYNDYKCEKCHTSSPATKQFSLEIPPIVLCLQLKRFTLYGTKINKPIHCNRALNLSSYINKAIRSENNVEAHYRLVGLVTHIGSSPNCGHYTAIASASNGQFYQFDDSYVRQCSFNAAQNSDAYVIIYEIDRSKSNHHHHHHNNINVSRPTSTVTSNSFTINKQPQTTVKTSSPFNPSKSPTSTNHFTSSSSPKVPPSSRTPPPTSVSPRPDVKVNGHNGVDVRFNKSGSSSGSSSSYNSINNNNSFNKNHINNNNISSSNQSKLKLTNGSSTNGLLVKEPHKNITININNKQLSNLYSNNNSNGTSTIKNGDSTEPKTTSPSSSSVNRSQSTSGSKLVNGNIDSKDQLKSSSSNSNNNNNNSNNKLPNGEISNKTSTTTTGNSSSSSSMSNNTSKTTATTTTTTSSDNSMVLLKTKLSNGDNNGKNKINTSNHNNNNTNTNKTINSKLVNGDVKISSTTTNGNNNSNSISKKLGHSEHKVKRVNNEVGIAKVKSSGSLQLVPYDDEDERVTTINGGSTYKNDTNSSYGNTSISSNEFPKKNTSKLVRPISSSTSSTTAFPSLWNKDNKIKAWNGGPSMLNSCISAERKRAFEKTKEELEDEEIDSGRVKKKPKSDSPTPKPSISFDDISRQRAASRNHVV